MKCVTFSEETAKIDSITSEPDFELFQIINDKYVSKYTQFSKSEPTDEDYIQKAAILTIQRADMVLQYITHDVKALVKKGFANLLMHRYGDAIASFENARDRDKYNLFSLLGLGWCFLKLRSKERALYYLIDISHNQDTRVRGFTISDHKWANRRALFGISKLYDKPEENFDKLTILNQLAQHEPDINYNIFRRAQLYHLVAMSIKGLNLLDVLFQKGINNSMTNELEIEIQTELSKHDTRDDNNEWEWEW